jgi:hypothetical protein
VGVRRHDPVGDDVTGVGQVRAQRHGDDVVADLGRAGVDPLPLPVQHARVPGAEGDVLVELDRHLRGRGAQPLAVGGAGRHHHRVRGRRRGGDDVEQQAGAEQRGQQQGGGEQPPSAGGCPGGRTVHGRTVVARARPVPGGGHNPVNGG